MLFFEYARPGTLREAVGLLAGTPGATVLAGGTDLLVQAKEHVRQPACVVDIKRLPGLDGFDWDARQGLRLGALVSTRQLETSALAWRHYAGLARACTDFASIQVRHRATVAGNVCRASPSADTLPPLIADEATLDIEGPRGARACRVEDFCLGPGRTGLQPGELVTGLRLPAPRPRTGKAYLKHGRRAQMELATVGVAVSLTLNEGVCEDLGIVLAAVGPTPLRAVAAERELRGQAVTAQAIARAAEAAAAASRPIDDVRASAAYRRDMVRVLTRRTLEQALEKALEQALEQAA